MCCIKDEILCSLPSKSSLIIFLLDSTLVLSVNSINRDNVSLSLNIIESTSEMGMEIDYNITQTINSLREW